jgi:hypothetical protein
MPRPGGARQPFGDGRTGISSRTSPSAIEASASAVEVAAALDECSEAHGSPAAVAGEHVTHDEECRQARAQAATQSIWT